MSRNVLIEADGGSRGNPGVAGCGSVVIDADTGELLVEIATYLGHATNNVAEYTALKRAVEAAKSYTPTSIHVRMDSKLVIEQMSGRWKIKHPDMARLAAEVRADLLGLDVSFEWVPRAQNSHADRLANKAMDDRATSTVWHVKPNA